ncbi:tRNA (adenosine(37)-N6)-threonylcarbamoyltransferase complex dimerization subunit type 1 TsaB [Actinotalea sp. M2MS4P-6]|uniref:tRNA (adenosine(37)-N6)-threonylcarbamoyltransferase complex dimerization subunit type 1 TsaB n=1 Tax=Actinotalea sp. M2MS4P-6 TaxID=2983762 RepID=UPI0021E49CDE|nr:tRNA (adenosine(37)-N6)-threonylcarbamoyltransferase complex dimerization subunit type 1 TsaB [Actinotalea sp. M2MS4P-6]MCV2395517.1 tRNA (adenosine(37)-N6)-threonylcarbamoyltransferase complex dimerization subunit type 1 TsaB [Actinotalea sp. M2MS4P-6]
MLVLALDTSADIAVALVRDGVALAVRTATEQRRHAELLSPLITEVFAEAGLRPREIDAVAVGTGPAPFTGLRAGLVTARALGFATGVPVHGVGSLEVLAAQAFDTGAEGDVLVVTDARRKEVYAGWFRASAHEGDVEATGNEDVVHPADLERRGAAVLVGPTAASLSEVVGLPASGPTSLDPVVLARLAVARAARGVDQPTEPLYLRRPDAVPPGARKRATG